MRSLVKSVWEYVVLASCFGLASGLFEIAYLLWQRYGANAWLLPTPESTLWLIPLADVGVFLTFALVFGALARVVPEFYNRRFALITFGFILFAKTLLLLDALHRAVLIWLALALAVQMARLVAHRYARLRPVIRYSTLCLLIMAVGYGGSSLYRQHSGPLWTEEKLPPEGSPNVLLITIDTVRAQSLSLYGYHRATSPQLQRWGAKGAVFERAYATAPWTFPSHASIFTGRYSTELSLDFSSTLGPAHATLAEVLSQSGYATASFVANRYWCTRDTGLQRGFALCNEYAPSVGQAIRSSLLTRTAFTTPRVRRLLNEYDDYGRRDADQLTRDFFAWLPGVGQRPFFAFLNFFDAHDPYMPPPPFDARFGPALDANDRDFLSIWWGRDKQRLPADKIELARRAYDSCIAYLDDRLGKLLDELQRRGQLDNTLVVIVADHGDQINDHKLYLHANSLYTELLHVPLVIIHPKSIPAGTRVKEEVTLRDLPATVLDVVNRGQSALPGNSLARHWCVGAYDLAAAPSPVLAVAAQRAKIMLRSCCPLQRGNMLSLIENGKHYIRTGKSEEQLFDLDADPKETHDLIETGQARETHQHMRARLHSLLEQHRAAGSTTAGQLLRD